MKLITTKHRNTLGALVWHNYGWICLVEGTEESIAMALTYADKSLSVLHGAPIFRALKGVALVESGDTKKRHNSS